MPLNILHHKSWHVYNVKNQERVRRDEHEAKLKEEEEERRMQEVDAERRMMILRKQMEQQNGGSAEIDAGGTAQGITSAHSRSSHDNHDGDEFPSEPMRERRKASPGSPEGNMRVARTTKYNKSAQAPLVGADGHINLFPTLDNPKDAAGAARGTTRCKSSQNVEYMADKAREEASYEAQYTMKISEPSRPWYASVDKVSQAEREKEEKKKQWEERIETRVRENNDPLNAIKSGLKKLREQREDVAREKKKRDADMGIGVDQRLLETRRRRVDEHDHRSTCNDDNDDRSRRRSGSRHHEAENERRYQGSNSSRQKEVPSRTESNHSRRAPEKHHDEARRSEKRSRSPARRHRRHHDRHRDRSRRSTSTSTSPTRTKRRGSPDRSRRRSRSPRREERRKHSPRQESHPEKSSMEKLREEQRKREQAERLKLEALLDSEQKFRNPERWTITSNSSGRGKYSRQFGA